MMLCDGLFDGAAAAAQGDADAFGGGDGLGVVDAEALVDGGGEVFGVDGTFGGFVALGIAGADDGSALDAAARH